VLYEIAVVAMTVLKRNPEEAEIAAALCAAGLIRAGVEPHFEALTGGVASDIWKIETGDRPIVVKRALPKLRVVTDWHAPVTRNAAEAAWFRAVRDIVPSAVPEVLFHSEQSGLFAMPYFPPEQYPVWKAELRDGNVDLEFAAEVGRTIAFIHAATMNSKTLAE
jgi:5-methylthioribose kinase